MRKSAQVLCGVQARSRSSIGGSVGLQRRQAQRGAAIIEVAFILLPLFLLVYGIFVYSIVFVTQQAVAYAAASGADAVIAVDPDTINCDPSDTTINALVTNRVSRITRVLPGGGANTPVVSLPTITRVSGCQLVVTVTYPVARLGLGFGTLFPFLGGKILTGQSLVNTRLPVIPGS